MVKNIKFKKAGLFDYIKLYYYAKNSQKFILKKVANNKEKIKQLKKTFRHIIYNILNFEVDKVDVVANFNTNYDGKNSLNIFNPIYNTQDNVMHEMLHCASLNKISHGFSKNYLYYVYKGMEGGYARVFKPAGVGIDEGATEFFNHKILKDNNKDCGSISYKRLVEFIEIFLRNPDKKYNECDKQLCDEMFSYYILDSKNGFVDYLIDKYHCSNQLALKFILQVDTILKTKYTSQDVSKKEIFVKCYQTLINIFYCKYVFETNNKNIYKFLNYKDLLKINGLLPKDWNENTVEWQALLNFMQQKDFYLDDNENQDMYNHVVVQALSTLKSSPIFHNVKKEYYDKILQSDYFYYKNINNLTDLEKLNLILMMGISVRDCDFGPMQNFIKDFYYTAKINNTDIQDDIKFYMLNLPSYNKIVDANILYKQETLTK